MALKALESGMNLEPSIEKLSFSEGSFDKGLKFLLISKESSTILNLYSTGTIELSRVPSRDPSNSCAPAGFLKFKNLVKLNFVLKSGSGHKSVSNGLKEKIEEDKKREKLKRKAFLKLKN